MRSRRSRTMSRMVGSMAASRPMPSIGIRTALLTGWSLIWDAKCCRPPAAFHQHSHPGDADAPTPGQLDRTSELRAGSAVGAFQTDSCSGPFLNKNIIVAKAAQVVHGMSVWPRNGGKSFSSSSQTISLRSENRRSRRLHGHVVWNFFCSCGNWGRIVVLGCNRCELLLSVRFAELRPQPAENVVDDG